MKLGDLVRTVYHRDLIDVTENGLLCLVVETMDTTSHSQRRVKVQFCKSGRRSHIWESDFMYEVVSASWRPS